MQAHEAQQWSTVLSLRWVSSNGMKTPMYQPLLILHIPLPLPKVTFAKGDLTNLSLENLLGHVNDVGGFCCNCCPLAFWTPFSGLNSSSCFIGISMICLTAWGFKWVAETRWDMVCAGELTLELMKLVCKQGVQKFFEWMISTCRAYLSIEHWCGYSNNIYIRYSTLPQFSDVL